MKYEDTEAVKDLHCAMERKVGRKLDLPDLMSEPVIASIVGETKDEITHAIFIEAQIECCSASANPLTAEDLKAAIEMLMPVAQGYNIQIARCFVPTSVINNSKTRWQLFMEWLRITFGMRVKPNRPMPIERTLDAVGFTKENETVKQFYMWLLPRDSEAQ